MGIGQNEIDAYFNKLVAAGFEHKANANRPDEARYSNQLRIGGELYQVELQRQKNDEIIEINYYFRLEDK
jgi:hypothetical protein